MSDTNPGPSAWRAVAAATALNAPLGSLYAFSVLVFALAAAGFGAGMVLAPAVYGVASAPVVLLACAAASTLGIALAATAPGHARSDGGRGSSIMVIAERPAPRRRRQPGAQVRE